MPADAENLPLQSRLLIGAIAGFAATVAMTMAMSRLHRRLPPDDQYPLPPREITERLLPEMQDDNMIKDSATAAHHGYGALGGALIAATAPSIGPVGGAIAGVGIWAASYFGWVPLADILTPAHRHPVRRNALMIGAHLVWGAVTAGSIRELRDARSSMLRAGPIDDANEPLGEIR